MFLFAFVASSNNESFVIDFGFKFSYSSLLIVIVLSSLAETRIPSMLANCKEPFISNS